MGIIKESLKGLRPRAVPYLVKSLTTVSFSLCGEDRIIKVLNPGPNGFYVDVGACHPMNGSNTYKLYLRGWQGLTIEPNPDIAPLFKKIRPRDEHVVTGVSREPAVMKYHKFENYMVNTFNLDDLGTRTDERIIATESIVCQPLTKILDSRAAERHIDFLNVDCEGMDLEVLQSMDWSKYRPSVVCVEDIVQYHLTASYDPQLGPIKVFMRDKDYWLIAQSLVSFFYIDKNLAEWNGSGFEIKHSWVGFLMDGAT